LFTCFKIVKNLNFQQKKQKTQRSKKLIDDIMRKEPDFLQWFVQVQVPAYAETMGEATKLMQILNFACLCADFML
jgi:hypothetical protein